MAEKEPETGPSLELPSLFGRRKRRAEQPRSGAARADAARSDGAGSELPGDTATVPRVDDSADDATTVIPPVEEEPPVAHTPAVTPTTVPTPTPTPHPAPEAERAAPTRRTPDPSPTPPPAKPRPTGGRRRARTSRRTVPDLAASTAAFLVGAVVGLAGCVLTYLGLQGCELVTGTGSCGGPGLLVLVVILVAMVLLGAAVLRTLRVPDPGNISFLGVGMLTVVALVFLVDYLYDPWMFVVVPVVTAATFGIARWITTLYAEDVLGDDDNMPRHDIR